MFDIIDFIFENLFFILLIGGAILNLLGKGKKEEQQNKKKQAPQKPVPEIDWKQIFEQEAKPIEPKQVQPIEPIEPETEPIFVEETEINPFEEEQKKLLQKQAELQKLEEDLQKVSSPQMVENIVNRKLTRQTYFHKITKDDVVRGVVWSEVLGPPRAKRPLEKIYRK